MPEGPSLYILKEQTARLVGRTLTRAEGNTWAIATPRLIGQPVLDLRTRGKRFLLVGTYRIDERRDKPPRLSPGFEYGSEINFYACSVKEIDCDIDAMYDWAADVMSDRRDGARARKLRALVDEARQYSFDFLARKRHSR